MTHTPDSPSPAGAIRHPTPTGAIGQRRGLRVAALLSAAAPAALALSSLSSPLAAAAAVPVSATAGTTAGATTGTTVNGDDPCVGAFTWPLGPSVLKVPNCAGLGGVESGLVTAAWAALPNRIKYPNAAGD